MVENLPPLQVFGHSHTLIDKASNAVLSLVQIPSRISPCLSVRVLFFQFSTSLHYEYT